MMTVSTVPQTNWLPSYERFVTAVDLLALTPTDWSTTKTPSSVVSLLIGSSQKRDTKVRILQHALLRGQQKIFSECYLYNVVCSEAVSNCTHDCVCACVCVCVKGEGR